MDSQPESIFCLILDSGLSPRIDASAVAPETLLL